MTPAKPKLTKIETLKIVIVVVFQLIIVQTALCQVSDGDEQFQAYHQDIGRISASPSNSPVAPPKAIIRQNIPVTSAPPPPPPPPPPPQHAVMQVFSHAQSRARQQHQQQLQKKPNRVVLAVRTQVPAPNSVVGEPTPAAVTAPAPVPVVQQVAAHVHSESASRQPLVASAAPHFQASFQPIMQPVQPVTGPALLSFQRSSGFSNSVTDRHSALMAQVAAERQQVASANPIFFHNQPKSPIATLSSLPVAQVQPPPIFYQPTIAATSPASSFVNRPEEPIAAPSFEQVLSQGCPNLGVFSYENKDHCDRYYMCTNGTFTEEACPNGLAYSQMGAIYQHCAYNWNVDCGRKKTSEPLASPGCPWQFGIFPASSTSGCSTDYFVCEWGVPETKRCTPEGLFYDDRIKGCQWADQLGCKSEALLNFKCPQEDEENRYWPYPRYYHTKQDVIVCVNEQPRLVHCNEDQIVDPSSLSCMDLKKKKIKKFQI